MRRIIICGSVIFVVTAAIVGVFLFNKNKTPNYNLPIFVTPVDAEILIDGKKYTNGLHNIDSESQHDISISKDGFESQSFTLDPGDFLEVKTYLKTDNLKQYSANRRDYVALKLIATPEDKEVNSFIEKTEHAKKIMNVLPTVTEIERFLPFIKIKYLDDPEKCQAYNCLYASYADEVNDDVKFSVKSEIQRLGFDIEDYEVVYGQ